MNHDELDDATADGDTTPATEADGQPAQPARFGRYHVLAPLGGGAMGVVLAAYDPYLDRKVALKLLHPGGPGRSPARLLREAHALARLSHPNVVQIHDTGALDDRVFLAMELVQGLDLRAWLATPHPPAEILRVFLDAGRGLAAAHDAGLVHRDFKPENVLVGADGRVRVADFGLVRHNDDDDDDDDTATDRPVAALDHSLTLTGAQLGTPAYMSPEQHLGQPADARSDQFSFCVALWEALHGERPFAGDGPTGLTAAVLAARPRPPPRASRAPRYLTPVLARGLARDPAQRHRDMHALLAALARDPARTRRRWWLGLGVAGLVAGAAIAARRSGEAELVCTGGPAELATVWTDARRDVVAAALARAADPSLPARALAGLDSYAADWLAGHRDACLDHRRGEQSSALLDARVRCLERRRQALGFAADVIADNTDADAAQVVARLPPLSACADAAAVLSESPVPADPTTAAEVAAIDAMMISAGVLHTAGDLAHALATADAGLQRARAAAFAPSIAEALLVQARVRFSESAYAAARPALAEALTVAVVAHRDDLAAEAIARLLYVDGVQHGRTDEAMRLAPLTVAMAERAPEPHAALGLAHNNISVVQQLAHEQTASAASLARAVDEMQAAPRVDPLDLAGTTMNAAVATTDPAARHAALTRATLLYSRPLGPEHLVSLQSRTHAAAFEPELTSARALLAATCPAYHRVHAGTPAFCAICFHRLAHVTAFLGDPRAALAAADQGLRCRPGPVLDDQDLYMRDKLLAFVATHEGRPEATLAAVDHAISVITPYLGRAWMAGEHAEFQLLRARALIQLGRTAEAAAALAPTLPVFEAAATDRPELLPRLWLAEAQALLATIAADPARAAELQAAAEATYAALGAGPPD